jgi:CHAT domain-containing protein
MDSILIWMVKLIKFKRRNICRLFLIAAAILFSNQSFANELQEIYYQARADGHYVESALLARRYVSKMDSERTWESPFSRASFIVSFGREASLFMDGKSVSWVGSELKAYIKLKDQPHDNIMNIALLSDAMSLINLSIPIKERIKTLRSFKKIVASKYLPGSQLVGFLIDCSNVYQEINDFAQAEFFIHRALAKAATRNDVAPYDVALVISHLAKLYGRSGRTRIVPKLTELIFRLDREKYLQSFEPRLVAIYSNLIQISLDHSPLDNTLGMLDYFKKFTLANKIEVPTKVKIEIFMAEIFSAALKGNTDFFMEVGNKIEGVFGFPIDTNHAFYRIVKSGMLNAKVNSGQNITPDEYSLLEAGLGGKLDAIALVTMFNYFVNHTDNEGEVASFIDKISEALMRSRKQIGEYFSHHREPSMFDVYTKEVLFRNLYSRFRDKIPNSISASLFTLVNKTSGLKSDSITRGRIEYSAAVDPELALEIKRFLKFSEERESLSLVLAERAIESSIKFVKRSFKYKKNNDPSNFSVELDFMRVDKFLKKSIDYIGDKDANLMGRISYPNISIKSISKTLIGGELYYFYEISRNYVFSCSIDELTYRCLLRPFKSKVFQTHLSALRKSISNFNDPDNPFAIESSNFIYRSIFDKNFSKLTPKKLFFKPAGIHLSVPFNALIVDLKNDESFLGLKQPIVVTPSVSSMLLSGNGPANSEVVKYLGVGDPKYNEIETAEVNVDKLFSVVRGGVNAKELSNLQKLPSTRNEILFASNNLPETDKNILLGDQATEINFRLLDHKSYKIMHFATHGLVSGEFEGLKQPALALSMTKGAGQAYKDGLLEANEISEFEFNADLIVLSACQTATDYGEPNISGFSGLTTAFIAAGAKRVLGSQWKVESKSATSLISKTVRRVLKSGELSENALFLSMKELRETLKFKHPYFWAPFIITGGGGRNLEKNKKAAAMIRTLDRKEIKIEGGNIEISRITKSKNGFSGTGYESKFGDKMARSFVYNLSPNLDFSKTYTDYIALRRIANVTGGEYYSAAKSRGDVSKRIIVKRNENKTFHEVGQYDFKNFKTNLLSKFLKTEKGYITMLEGIEKKDGSGKWLHDLLFFDGALALQSRINIDNIQNDTGLIRYKPKIYYSSGVIYMYFSTSEQPSRFANIRPEGMPKVLLKNSSSKKYNFILGNFECLNATDTHIYKWSSDNKKFKYFKYVPRFKAIRFMGDKELLILGNGGCSDKTLQVKDVNSGDSIDISKSNLNYSLQSILSTQDGGWILAGSATYDISSFHKFGYRKSFNIINFTSPSLFMGSNTARVRILYRLDKNFRILSKKLVPHRGITFYGPALMSDKKTVVTFGVDGRSLSFVEKLRITN